MAKKSAKKTSLKKTKMGPAGVLILAGILLILAGNILSWSNNLGNIFQPLLAKEKEDSFYFLPQTIFIPSISLKAPIKIGGIAGGQWILRTDSVMVMSPSGHPWEDKSLILYAHKRKGLFLDLKNLAIGDKIVLEGLSGKSFVYEVVSKEDTKPDQVSKLQSDTANTLALFTCDGLFDESRFIVKAKLISS
jgi:LPXTG-site transpeptidase (sortase) family protein